MHTKIYLSIFWLSNLLLPGLLTAATEAELPASLVNPGYHEQPAWFSQTFLDLSEDVAEAAAQNKQLMLYFYQDGCPYCAKLLRDNFADPAIARQIQQHFNVIALNIWGDREVTDLQQNSTTEKAYARQLQVHYTPTLITLDQAGQVALRLNGYVPPDQMRAALNYAIAKRTGTSPTPQPNKTKHNSAPLPPLAAALPHPLRLAHRTSQRPLLVIFGAHDCPTCRRLQQRLQQPTLATALTNFDVAQMNRWSEQSVQTPTGDTLSARAWADQLQLHMSPSLVFFDASGQPVFRVESDLESFHLHAVLDYVSSGAYRYQPSLQRFLQHRVETLEARGLQVELLDQPIQP